MTFTELLNKAEKNMNCAYTALLDMMDIIEEQTGSFPSWSDEAPEWILNNFGYGYLDKPVSEYQIHGFLFDDDSNVFGRVLEYHDHMDKMFGKDNYRLLSGEEIK